MDTKVRDAVIKEAEKLFGSKGKGLSLPAKGVDKPSLLEKLLVGKILMEDPILEEKAVYEKVRPELFKNSKLGAAFLLLRRGERDVQSVAKQSEMLVSKLLDCQVLYAEVGLPLRAVSEYATSSYREYTKKLVNDSTIANEEITEALNSLSEITPVYSGKQKVLKMKEVREKRKKQIKGGLLGYSTGWKSLDGLTGGLVAGEVWVIGGVPRVGKSYFATNVVNQVLYGDRAVAIISLEMTDFDNMARIVGVRCGASRVDVIKGETEKIKAAYTQVEESISREKLILWNDVATIPDLTERLTYLKTKKEIGLVVIDFIQRFVGKESQYETLRMAANSIANIALELNSTVFIVSQVSKDAYATEALSYKGAGDIGEVAHVGIRINRSRNKDTQTKTDDYDVRLGKNRSGREALLNYKIKFPGGIIDDGSATVEY